MSAMEIIVLGWTCGLGAMTIIYLYKYLIKQGIF